MSPEPDPSVGDGSRCWPCEGLLRARAHGSWSSEVPPLSGRDTGCHRGTGCLIHHVQPWLSPGKAEPLTAHPLVFLAVPSSAPAPVTCSLLSLLLFYRTDSAVSWEGLLLGPVQWVFLALILKLTLPISQTGPPNLSELCSPCPGATLTSSWSA